MKIRAGISQAFAGSALLVLSCGADREREHARVDTGAREPVASTVAVVESPTAASRVAELRARFPLAFGAPAAARFERAAGPNAATHVRAALPEEARRGVTRPAHVELPARANGGVELEDERSRLSVTFALDGVHDTYIAIAAGVALYRGALDGADVVHRVDAEGTEDFVVFETRPAHEELTYSVGVSRIPGLRLVSNTLELLDGTGTPLLRVAPPYVVDARGARHEATLAVSGCAYDASPAAPWGRPVTSPGAAACTVRVRWAREIDYPIVVDPKWGTTGSMTVKRAGHAATLLASGKVLVTGADSGSGAASAELYDPGGGPAAGTFAATGSMTIARAFHTGSLLSSGKVLIAGGLGALGNVGTRTTAELYDPAGTFTATTPMVNGHAHHTASVLASGKVLVAGGNVPRASIFDPAANGGAGAFGDTDVTMTTVRSFHTATVLPSGKVLVAGGEFFDGGAAVSTAEIFDPNLGSFAATGSMTKARGQHTATLLPSGKVLVAGGRTDTAADLFDPAGNGGVGTFAATGSMAAARFLHTASLLPSGDVLVAGGFPTRGPMTGGALASAELFEPGPDKFSTAGLMLNPHGLAAALVLPSGKVLVAGGQNAAQPGASAELYGGAQADACTSDAYCLSGFCVDGFCCESACDAGSCDRCDLPGREGSCRVAPAGDPGKSPACALPYACDGMNTGCPTSCASDASCAAAYYCDQGGDCRSRSAQAAPCDPTASCKVPGCRQCESDFCVSGVCCDSACEGPCQTCVAALAQEGSADGVCSPVKDGTNPKRGCAAGGTPCGPDGLCNSTGACRLATPFNTPCEEGKICDGQGACIVKPAAGCDGDHTTTGTTGRPQDCSPYRCAADGACLTKCSSVQDCVSPAVCDADGKCVPAHPDAGIGSGCGVSKRGPRGDGGRTWAVALLVLFARARARRRGG